MAGRTADVEAFLVRLVRLDPAALVRVRYEPRHTTLWGRVPWNALVSRTVAGTFDADRDAIVADIVVRASDWLDAPAETDARDLARVDAKWRSPLPPSGRDVLEVIPAAEVRRLAAAAADTLRATEAGGIGGRAVGSRAVRDALLDHVAIVVSAGPSRVEIPQRLVQAVVRMGFAAADDEPVRVLRAGPWIGLAAAFGTAWWRPTAGLTLTPTGR
ncbi:MAG TPA: hypothetical protein VH442_15485 [Micromonosporaceae bacterium]|jgi:hypothetical protein